MTRTSRGQKLLRKHYGSDPPPPDDATKAKLAQLDPIAGGAMDGRPDEPPPSLVPPEVQAEIDRLVRENRALKAAMRALLGEEA